MYMLKRSITTLLAIAAFVGVFFLIQRIIPPAPWTVPGNADDGGAVACTMEARLCPDGSSVGRVPPSCDFALCPVTSTSSPAISSTTPLLIVTYINRGASAFGIKVTPLAILEDSRCPVGYTCIQAGVVKVRVQVATASQTNIFELLQGAPITVGDHYVTLSYVEPKRSSGQTIPQDQYQLSFKIEKIQ